MVPPKIPLQRLVLGYQCVPAQQTLQRAVLGWEQAEGLVFSGRRAGGMAKEEGIPISVGLDGLGRSDCDLWWPTQRDWEGVSHRDSHTGDD